MTHNQKAIDAMQKAFHEADEAGCSIDDCWQAAIEAYEQNLWQPISEYNLEEDVDVIVFNGDKVQCATKFEGVFSDNVHDYIDPQPTLFRPPPTPPKQSEEEDELCNT